MKIIGLTGGIASGKSTASSILKKFGATIIDADLLAHQAVAKGEAALDAIIKTFGKQVLQQDGTLNRKALGDLIFSDSKKRLQLNKIVHPAVHEKVRKSFQQEQEKGRGKIVYDCPLLLEENLVHMVDEVWLIYTDEATQLTRLMQRDGFTKAEAMERIKSQLPLKVKLKQADVVIENNGTLEDLEEKLRKYWHEK